MLLVNILLIALVSFISATPIEESNVYIEDIKIRPLSDLMVYHINEVVKTTWTAGESKFKDWSWESIKRQMGVPLYKINNINQFLSLNKHSSRDVQELPEEFDSRDKWPQCPTLKEIRDQGNCGSCWAISAVETMSDRVCIHSNATKNAHLSTEDMVSCCHICGFGCNGGYPEMAWEYFKRSGVCTGGNFNTHEGCKPYTIEECEHHTQGNRPPCQGESKTPKCTSQCQDGYTISYKDDKWFGSSVFTVKGEEQIKAEIFKNGPVQTAFTVYDDFLNYKNGVYQHKAGSPVGGHAVKMVGWGVDKETNTPYWLIANSWNTDWAEQGYFRIKRGSNECGIESNVVAGLPNA